MCGYNERCTDRRFGECCTEGCFRLADLRIGKRRGESKRISAWFFECIGYFIGSSVWISQLQLSRISPGWNQCRWNFPCESFVAHWCKKLLQYFFCRNEIRELWFSALAFWIWHRHFCAAWKNLVAEYWSHHAANCKRWFVRGNESTQ